MTVIAKIRVLIYQTTWNEVPEESSFNTQKPRGPQILRNLLVECSCGLNPNLSAIKFIEFLSKHSL